jgi:para-nitrobenzyl esterase
LDARGNAAPAFAYRFDWRSSLLGGIMGACHALDIGFTFGTHKKGIAGTFFGTGLAAEALADTMMDAWTSFARTGDPATQATGPWPRYDAQSRPTLIFGDGAPHIMHTPNETRLRAWDAIPERKLGL